MLDNTKEIRERCQQELSEIMGTTPLKGNISYFVEHAENDVNSFEIVRAAHGGGNNQSRRKGGGVVIVTVKVVPVVGEISPIHGTTYYQQENKDNLFGFLGL